MAEESKIAWTDATFNPWIGCAKVSAGCKNCYAEVDTFARRSRAGGLELWGVDGARHVTSDGYWQKPHQWDRKAKADGVRRRVFCASMADVFEDRRDLDVNRARLWSLICDTPNLDWLLLTKRPEHANRLWLDAQISALADGGSFDYRERDTWQPNVWLGTTVEDQESADERIPHLLRVPAAVRFLSCEPLLERVSVGLLGTMPKDVSPRYAAVHERLHWIIVGGESGAHARPFDVDWARDLVTQGKEAGVPVFVKQMGSHAYESTEQSWQLVAGETVMDVVDMRNAKLDLRDKKGGDWDEWPAELRVRQFPELGGRS